MKTALNILLLILSQNSFAQIDIWIDDTLSFRHFSDIQVFDKKYYTKDTFRLVDSYDLNDKQQITSSIHSLNSLEDSMRTQVIYHYSINNTLDSTTELFNYDKELIKKVYYNKHKKQDKSVVYHKGTQGIYLKDSFALDSLKKGYWALSFDLISGGDLLGIGTQEGEARGKYTLTLDDGRKVSYDTMYTHYEYLGIECTSVPDSVKIIPRKLFYSKYTIDTIVTSGWFLDILVEKFYNDKNQVSLYQKKEYHYNYLINFDSIVSYYENDTLIHRDSYFKGDRRKMDTCTVQYFKFQNNRKRIVSVYPRVDNTCMIFSTEILSNDKNDTIRLYIGEKKLINSPNEYDRETAMRLADMKMLLSKESIYNERGQIIAIRHYNNGELIAETRFKYKPEIELNIFDIDGLSDRYTD